MHCSAGVGSCAATTAACSAATNAAVMAAIISTQHANAYYDRKRYRYYGKVSVNLKGTRTEFREAKGWFRRIFVGDRTWEQEAITQTEYLKTIYDVLGGLGYDNVLFVDLDGRTIYEDRKKTEGDFDRAMKLALDEAPQGSFKIGIALDTTRDSKANLLVTMDSRHGLGKYPLTIEVMQDEPPDALLDRIKAAVEQHFDTEAVEFDLGD